MERADFASVLLQDSFKLSRVENGKKLFVEEPNDFGEGVSVEHKPSAAPTHVITPSPTQSVPEEAKTPIATFWQWLKQLFAQ